MYRVSEIEKLLNLERYLETEEQYRIILVFFLKIFKISGYVKLVVGRYKFNFFF